MKTNSSFEDVYEVSTTDRMNLPALIKTVSLKISFNFIFIFILLSSTKQQDLREYTPRLHLIFLFFIFYSHTWRIRTTFQSEILGTIWRNKKDFTTEERKLLFSLLLDF